MSLMQQRHYEYIADNIAPMLPFPTHIVELGHKLQSTNPKFNFEKFVARATKAWEDNNLISDEELDDYIPQLHEKL